MTSAVSFQCGDDEVDEQFGPGAQVAGELRARAPPGAGDGVRSPTMMVSMARLKRASNTSAGRTG